MLLFLESFFILLPSLSSGRGILLKPAPGTSQAEVEVIDAEKGGKDGDTVGRGVRGDGVKVGGKNPTSPPLLPLLAASRDPR